MIAWSVCWTISNVSCSKWRTAPRNCMARDWKTYGNELKNEGLIFKIRVAGSKLAQGEML